MLSENSPTCESDLDISKKPRKANSGTSQPPLVRHYVRRLPLKPSVVTPDLDSLAINDPHMGADLDKVANLYSSRNYHNLFVRSFLVHFYLLWNCKRTTSETIITLLFLGREQKK